MHDTSTSPGNNDPAPATPSGTPSPSGGHPAELHHADGPYFAPWGRGEILRWSLICLVLAGGFAASGSLYSPGWFIGLVPTLAFWAFMVLFFRNPRRAVPTDASILVSPADGTVWDIEELDEAEFIGERCVRVGIFLSVFNVHVNRAPCRARVEYVKYREGEFRDARSSECARVNESNTLGLVITEEGPSSQAKMLLRQVSGAIARHIICPLEVGTEVERGGLIGMIKYGSRTEIWLPLSAGFECAVQRGDKVSGGASVLGRFVAAGESHPEGESHRESE